MGRKATLTDFEALYETYMDPRNKPFMLWEIMDRESFLPIVREMVAAGNLYVYEVDGRVAGAYRLTRKQHRLSHVAYLGSFAVDPQFKGKALGTHLMLDLLDDLRSAGVKRLELLVVTDNHKAIEFYKRLGFEVEGILQGFLKRANSEEYVDELAMSLFLNERQLKLKRNDISRCATLAKREMRVRRVIRSFVHPQRNDIRTNATCRQLKLRCA